jgi:hypothetical protein
MNPERSVMDLYLSRRYTVYSLPTQQKKIMDHEQQTSYMIEWGLCLERVLVGKVDGASTRCHHEDVHDVRCHVTKQ